MQSFMQRCVPEYELYMLAEWAISFAWRSRIVDIWAYLFNVTCELGSPEYSIKRPLALVTPYIYVLYASPLPFMHVFYFYYISTLIQLRLAGRVVVEDWYESVWLWQVGGLPEMKCWGGLQVKVAPMSGCRDGCVGF